MTGQKERILESKKYLQQNLNIKKSVSIGLITYNDPLFLKEFQIIKRIKLEDIPPKFNNSGKANHGEFIYAKLKKRNINVFILNGRYNYLDGYKMRDISHPIYFLKELGVNKILLVDEVGFLNPRFEAGEIALIYDHINLMGDNPLIGQNDDSIGPRFPDMSNAYNEVLYRKTEKIFIEAKFKWHPSVYLGLTGPETETEAECRFYRDIGADVLGYGIVPENIAAVHCGIKCIAFGMISRELVADRLREIGKDEQLKNRVLAEKKFTKLLGDIIKVL